MPLEDSQNTDLVLLHNMTVTTKAWDSVLQSGWWKVFFGINVSACMIFSLKELCNHSLNLGLDIKTKNGLTIQYKASVWNI